MSAALAARIGDEIGSHGHGWLGLIAGAAAGIIVGALIVGATIAAGAALIATGGALAIVAGALIATGGVCLGGGTLTGLTAIGAKLGKSVHGPKCSEVGKDGSPNVLIENRKAARAKIDEGTHDHNKIAQGSSTVFVNGYPLSREGDGVKCGGKLLKTCDNTWVGGAPVGEASNGPSEKLVSGLETTSQWLMGIGGVCLLAGTALAGAVVGGIWGGVVAGGKALGSAAAWTVGGSLAHSLTQHYLGANPALILDAGMMLAGPLMGARSGMKGLRALYDGNALPSGLPAPTIGAPHADAVIVGEGPVGLATAIKVKAASPESSVVLLEKRALTRSPRPNTPTYFPETLETLKSVGLDPSDENFTLIRERLEVAQDGYVEHQPLERPTIEGKHTPYSTGDMLDPNSHGVATNSIGNTEAQLREVAQKLGVDIRYQSDVTAARNVSDGVELTVGGKDGPQTLHSSYAVIADGASGIGQQMSVPNIRGNVPMMAAATDVVGDGTFMHAKYDEPSAAGGYIVLTKIGSESGVSVLAEVPPRLDSASPAERTAWFTSMAEKMGIPATSFKTEPMAFPAKLSEGKIGHGRIFVIGDAAGTVPIISGSGVNKGVRQGVDTGHIIAFALEHPTLMRAMEADLLAIHATREQRAQTKLVDGIQGYVGDHLRSWPPPEPCATCAAVKAKEALPDLAKEAIAKGAASPAGVWEGGKPIDPADAPLLPISPSVPRILNLGGEGEGPGIELNLLDPDAVRKPIAKIKKDAAGRLVQGDMLHMPFAENSMEGVIGNKVPAVPTLVNGMPAEAFRGLQPGGTIRVSSSSGGAKAWLQPLRDAGFVDVTEQSGYAVGVKPLPVANVAGGP